jgi:hypothetical protein
MCNRRGIKIPALIDFSSILGLILGGLACERYP